jgi:hypothetical protein
MVPGLDVAFVALITSVIEPPGVRFPLGPTSPSDSVPEGPPAKLPVALPDPDDRAKYAAAVAATIARVVTTASARRFLEAARTASRG